MRDGERESRFDILFPNIHPLPWQPIDKVDGDIARATFPHSICKTVHSPHSLSSSMSPAQKPQHPVVEALNAQTNAIHASLDKCRSIPCSNIVWIHLNGNLSTVCYIIMCANTLQYASYLMRGEQRRSASAHVHTAYGISLHRPAREFSLQSSNEDILQNSALRLRVEIAIYAARLAERHVYVQSCGHNGHRVNFLKKRMLYFLLLLCKISIFAKSIVKKHI